MTTVRSDPEQLVADPRSHRPIMIAGAVSVVVVLLAVIGLFVVRHVSAVREADRYKPFEFSTRSYGFFGPDGDSPDHLAGDLNTTHLAGPAGTKQRILVPLFVNGSHDVHIDSIKGEDLVSRVQWSKFVFRNGSYASGEKQPWKDFPTTLKAHQVVRLGIVLRKPSGCGNGLTRPWSTGLIVRWSALGKTHTDCLRAAEGYILYGCG